MERSCKPGERRRRLEVYNALNRHQLGGINTNINNPLFGQVTNVSGNRTGQIGMRLDF